MAIGGLQGSGGDELLPLSGGDSQDGKGQPAVPEATTWGPRSGRGFSAIVVSAAMLMTAALVAVASLQVAHVGSTPSPAAAHPRDLHELAHATLRRFSKVRKLLPAGKATGVAKSILKYQSADEHGEPGVFLGRMDEAGSTVASDVELDATHFANMTFIVGPEVEGAGPLVRGDLTLRDDCAVGMCGTIRAGFVNIHSTLSGTWQTEGDTLDGVIHIRWIEPEMQIDQKLTWTPVENDKQVVHETPAIIVEDPQEVQKPSGNECERQASKDACSQHKPTDSYCFCSWGGDFCMMACA